jgi:hypothetical protein
MNYGIHRREAIWVAALAFCLAGVLMLRLGYNPALHAVATLAGFLVGAPLWIKAVA